MNTTQPDWMKNLATTRDGRVRDNPSNIRAIIANDDATRGLLWTSTMDGRVYFGDEPLSTRAVDVAMPRCRELTVSRASLRRVREAMEAIAKENRRSPVARALRALRWDGVARLDALASRVLGNDSADAAGLVKRWMLGAVESAIHPERPSDQTLFTLSGPCDSVSSFLSTLAGPLQWYRVCPIFNVRTARDARLCPGWIVEVPLLDAMASERRFERAVSELLRHDERAPTRGALCATVTKADSTPAHRARLRVVDVSRSIDAAYVLETRAQLWAEAVRAFDAMNGGAL